MTEFVQALLIGLLIGGTYALVGTGLSLIYGVMQIVNLAHGALLILAAYLSYTLWNAFGIDPLAGVLLTTPAMFGIGWVLYSALIRPVRDDVAGAAILLPFGLALLLEATMGVIWGNVSTSTRPSYVDESFDVGAFFLPKVQVFGALLAVVVLGALLVFLRKSWTGRAIRAASTNPEGAALVGINVGAVAAITFATGVAATAAGGSIVGMLSPIVPASGLEWLVRLLAIVVLGGMGSISGTVLAGLVLGISESLASNYIGLEWTVAMPLIVVFVVLIVRPQGLLGTRLREDVAT